jgi:hypothetical protein
MNNQIESKLHILSNNIINNESRNEPNTDSDAKTNETKNILNGIKILFIEWLVIS